MANFLSKKVEGELWEAVRKISAGVLGGAAETGGRPAGAEKPPVIRPFVKASFKNGTVVEGLLMRFADGVYTVKRPESLAEFHESAVQEIRLSPRRRRRVALWDRLAVLSQLQSVQDFIDAYYAQGPKAAAEMADLMNDGDPQVRRMAAQAISNWVHFGRTALPQELRALLIKALRDEDPEVRRLIPGPLARMGVGRRDRRAGRDACQRYGYAGLRERDPDPL